MVATFAAHAPVTPGGRLLKVAPVAPLVAYVMFAKRLFSQRLCASLPAMEVRVKLFSGFTFIVPLMLTFPQPPVHVTV